MSSARDSKRSEYTIHAITISIWLEAALWQCVDQIGTIDTVIENTLIKYIVSMIT